MITSIYFYMILWYNKVNIIYEPWNSTDGSKIQTNFRTLHMHDDARITFCDGDCRRQVFFIMIIPFHIVKSISYCAPTSWGFFSITPCEAFSLYSIVDKETQLSRWHFHDIGPQFRIRRTAPFKQVNTKIYHV